MFEMDDVVWVVLRKRTATVVLFVYTVIPSAFFRDSPMTASIESGQWRFIRED